MGRAAFGEIRPDMEWQLMRISHDRRQIAGLLREHFPALPEDMSSDDWHGWLNAQTGLDLPIDGEEGMNANVFDQWRQALAAQGIPVWGYTPGQIAEMKAKAVTLKAHVDEFNEGEKARLAALKLEAPDISAADLLK